MDEVKTFHWADYLVLALSLLLSAGIGVFFAIRDWKKTSNDVFLLGGRSMGPFPVAMSMTASFTSAIYIIGVPAEIYFNGTMFAAIFVGYILFLIVGAEIFVPFFHRMNITSAHEYLERRFNKVIRIMGSLTFDVMMILYMAVVIYAPAIAYEQVTGVPSWITVLVCGAVCAFYTTLGGMKAVIWTDTFQMIVIIIGTLALLIQGAVNVGGIVNVWEIAKNGSRLEFDVIDADPRIRHSWWTQSIGTFFTYISLVGANQTSLQRYFTIKKTRDAKIALYIVLVTSLLLLTLVTLLGLVMYASYHTCDPYLRSIALKTGELTNPNQMVPFFMMDVLGQYHGLNGLFTAGVIAAALSTVSSAVNSLAAVFIEDIVKPAYSSITQKNMTEKAQNWTAKGLALLFGILSIALSFVAPFFGKTLISIALSIFGTAGGPLFAVFALGMFFPCVNSWGAGAGLLGSIIFTYWLSIGGIVNPAPPNPLPLSLAGCPRPTPLNVTMTTTMATTTSSILTTIGDGLLTTAAPVINADNPIHEFYRTSYMWQGLFSLLVAIVIGLLVSCLTGCKQSKPVDRSLLYVFAEEWFCCCTEECKTPCRCGVPPPGDGVKLQKVEMRNGENQQASDDRQFGLGHKDFYGRENVGYENEAKV